MASLEELRKDARKLESMLDVKLVSYAKLGANFAHSTLLREEDHSHSTSPWSEDVSNSMALEIDQLLHRVLPPPPSKSPITSRCGVTLTGEEHSYPKSTTR
jgi:hypothetical protein